MSLALDVVLMTFTTWYVFLLSDASLPTLTSITFKENLWYSGSPLNFLGGSHGMLLEIFGPKGDH